MNNPSLYDVAIIGAGLSGLCAAHMLHQAGRNVIVLEAGNQPGGRIKSLHDSETGSVLADLGPTWVWPQYQPIVAKWLTRLDIATFEQFEEGHAILDLVPNEAPHRQFLPGQHGIRRIVNGPQTLIDALVARLPQNCIRTGCAVSSITQKQNCMELEFADSNIQSIYARRVVVAVPPRMAIEKINWNGLLDQEFRSLLQTTPTWMATQAKVVIIYEKPFWREMGLSGRIASQLGPLVEVHDHCGKDGVPAALFGFVGWPHELRATNAENLQSAVIEQLTRCFGQMARNFVQIQVEDWAKNPFICTNADLNTPPDHPITMPEIVRKGFIGDQVFFASAETAIQNPGLIDGAFEAGERAAQAILSVSN